MSENDCYWAMWEAIGTLLAVFVALFLASFRELKEFLDRPKIEIDKNGIFRERAGSLFLSLRTINKGRTTAQNVNFKIESITQNNSDVLVSGIDKRIETGINLNLQNGNPHFLPLFEFLDNRELRCLIADTIYLENKSYLVKILVTGDNIKPMQKTFKYIHSSEIKKIKLTMI